MKHALEAENRVLNNLFQDLEFQLEEMRLKHENLTGLKKRLRDLEIEMKYADFLLKERQLDLEFIDNEIEKIQADEESIDIKSRIQAQVDQMNQEIEQNKDNLEVLHNEEREALLHIRDRENRLSMLHKPLPKGWAEDRDSHMEEKEALQDALEYEKEKLRAAEIELEKLQMNRFDGTDVDGNEVVKALAAELRYIRTDPIHEAINSELEYRETLKRELDAAKLAAKSVKKYRDMVVKRHERQFELASLQSRLESLHETHL